MTAIFDELASRLAELDLEGQELAGLKWIVTVQSQAPVFTLTDIVENKKSQASTINDVLKLLEGDGADKNSPA